MIFENVSPFGFGKLPVGRKAARPILSSSLSFTPGPLGGCPHSAPWPFPRHRQCTLARRLLPGLGTQQNFTYGHAFGHDVQYERNPDAVPPDTGFTKANIGVNSNPGKQHLTLIHSCRSCVCSANERRMSIISPFQAMNILSYR